MNEKIAYIATCDDDDFEEYQIIFESEQDCIEYCKSEGNWSWRHVQYIPASK